MKYVITIVGPAVRTKIRIDSIDDLEIVRAQLSLVEKSMREGAPKSATGSTASGVPELPKESGGTRNSEGCDG